MQNNMDARYLTPEEVKQSLVNLSQLVFEVTDDCNLRCVYCAYGKLYCDYDERGRKYLQLSDVKRLIDHLAELWKNSLPEAAVPETTLGFYGGEPLLNVPFIKDVIDYVDSLNLNRKIKYSMTTNGVLLDRYMDYLVEKNFTLLISLDGDEYADGYRVNKDGRNLFPVVMKNVRKLKEKYPDYFASRVDFNSVLHDRNDVESLLKFFKAEFSKRPNLSEISTVGLNPQTREMFDKMHNTLRKSIHKSENCEQLIDELFLGSPEVYAVLRNIETESNNVIRSYRQLLPFENKGAVPTGTCIPFSRKLFVTVNGKILPCEKVSHAYYLGRVTADELSLDCVEIAEKHNGYLKKVLGNCGGCALKLRCLQCVYQIDGLTQHTVSCRQHISLKDREKYNVDCFKYLNTKRGLYRKILDAMR